MSSALQMGERSPGNVNLTYSVSNRELWSRDLNLGQLDSPGSAVPSSCSSSGIVIHPSFSYQPKSRMSASLVFHRVIKASPISPPQLLQQMVLATLPHPLATSSFQCLGVRDFPRTTIHIVNWRAIVLAFLMGSSCPVTDRGTVSAPQLWLLRLCVLY